MAFEIDLLGLAAVAADLLMAGGALGAALYCLVLARRLKRFNNLENGVGGAVAVLSAQVDDMTRTLERAREAAAHSAETLTALTDRAESGARRLELMMAALHDLPEAAAPEAADAARGDDDEDLPGEVPLFSSRRARPREAAA